MERAAVPSRRERRGNERGEEGGLGCSWGWGWEVRSEEDDAAGGATNEAGARAAADGGDVTLLVSSHCGEIAKLV